MVVYELGQDGLFGLAFCARGESQNHPIRIFLTAYEVKPVVPGELERRSPPGAFVAIKEGVNEYDARCVAGCYTSYVLPSSIEPKPLRPRERLLQETASSSGGCSLVDCRGGGGCASCVVVVA